MPYRHDKWGFRGIGVSHRCFGSPYFKIIYDKAAFSVERVAHSVVTEKGESDLEVTLYIDGRKVALLIEDKIDAAAMPEQATRYTERGQEAKDQRDYDEFYVFIVAPRAYLKREQGGPAT